MGGPWHCHRTLAVHTCDRETVKLSHGTVKSQGFKLLFCGKPEAVKHIQKKRGGVLAWYQDRKRGGRVRKGEIEGERQTGRQGAWDTRKLSRPPLESRRSPDCCCVTGPKAGQGQGERRGKIHASICVLMCCLALCLKPC